MSPTAPATTITPTLRRLKGRPTDVFPLSPKLAPGLDQSRKSRNPRGRPTRTLLET